MIQVTPQMRVLVALEPADFRKGIDGLARLAKAELQSDPFSGTLFVFRNRRATAIKCLVYDGQGFWLCQKRLSAGRFRFWPKSSSSDKARAFEVHELAVLLRAGDFEATAALEQWRPVAARA